MQNQPFGVNSDALWSRAERVLAGGPATLSKLPSRYPQGVSPKFLKAGLDAYVTDVDDHSYLDIVAALGPVLLGHRHGAVEKAVKAQIDEGLISATLSTALEVEVAEMLTEIIPGAEMVRFASNGADVTNAAIKLARCITGASHVIFTGYHGGHDSYLATTDKSGGTLPVLKNYNHQFAWPNVAEVAKCANILQRIGENIAAIMVEVPPEPLSTSKEQTTEVLSEYLTIARDCGALFILDEVVTGFRYAIGGAQEYYGITADLACFSKAMANGFPCAAITGPREIMRRFEGGEVFMSTTFGANPIGLAACKATILALQKDGVHANLVHCGTMLQHKLASLIESMRIPATLRGNFARMVIDWHDAPGRATKDELRTLWLQETITRGILFGVPIFPMACWTDDIVHTIWFQSSLAMESIAGVVRGDVSMQDVLHCPVITDVFQRYNPGDNW